MQNINKREGLDFYLVLTLGFFALLFFMYWNATHPYMVIRYDCSIAEISPDYPTEVKEGCRKLRAENFKENLQKPK